MLADRAGKGGGLEIVEELPGHPTFTQGAPAWLPAFGRVLPPIEVFEIDRPPLFFRESRLDRRGETAFDHRLTNVETEAHGGGIEFLHHQPQIPDRCSDVIR